VDLTTSDCLNEMKEYPFQNILGQKAPATEEKASYLRSETDPQLLLHLCFTQAVKIHSIKFDAPDDGSGPKNVKLFVNKTMMGFTEAEDDSATQEIVLTPHHLQRDAAPIQLRLAKFQNVSSLTIFVKDNQENREKTQINRLYLWGQPLQGTEMKNFKKVENAWGPKNTSDHYG